jgi:PmbA protein
LKDKINQNIFSKRINIIDKPDILKGLGSRYFDSEGVKTETLKLVDQGTLKHYLIDTYNGKKLNLKSNGRCGGTSNLYFDNGNISFKDLLNLNSKSIYITETIGHGSNIVTGDYSVGATGFLVEQGEFKYPINEITIAGNFKDMFKNITLANDLEFKYATNSPTMMIDGMVVAGK